MELKRLNVLVVEDEVLVAESLEGMLEDLGHTVAGRASNGLMAVEMAAERSPDAILMDIKMPKLNGLEATRRIFETSPTPVVVLSAYESKELVAKASMVGVAAYLTKPTSRVELERVLAIVTARFADYQELRKKNEKLSQSLTRLKGQTEILPICAGCKKIRDESGVWQAIECYFGEDYNIDFSHGMCPDCIKRLYDEYSQKL